MVFYKLSRTRARKERKGEDRIGKYIPYGIVIFAPCSGAETEKKIELWQRRTTKSERSSYSTDRLSCGRHPDRKQRRQRKKHIAAALGKVEPLDESIQDWDFSLKGNTVVNRKREEASL